QESASAVAGSAAPAFAMEIRAPAAVRLLLERHLELRRYQGVSDLDDAEFARLMVLAERDARELLGTMGYFSPVVALERRAAAAGNPRAIVITVEPGEPTTIGEVNIDFEGDIAGSADAAAQREAIRSGWRMPAGQRFTQDGWDAAKAQALQQLVARRYPGGRVSYSLADVDAPAARAGLGLRLDSGPLFRLGRLEVTGVERYDPLLVPRLSRLSPGMVYDQEQLLQAQLRLASSGYFDSAFIYVDPAGNPKAAPVQVNLREAPLHKVVLGVGITTDSGPRASVEYLNNRVPGIGWRAATKLQAERKAPFAQTEWTAIPGEDGWRWGVLARAERLDDDELVTHGQRLRLGRSRAGDHIDRNVYVQYERATVQAKEGVPAILADNGDGTALSVNYVWTGRYFDRLPFPSTGNGIGFELGGGVTLSGSKSPFQRTVLRWQGIRPFSQAAQGRLQMRAEGGAVLARSSARVPSTQMFRTGGDTTVRGYGYREIGVDHGGGVVGPGRYMAVGSVEWQRPIRRGGLETNFESALFVDAGAVANRPGALRPAVGVGAGVRWKSPLGPFQVDLAYGVKPRRLRLHFNVGVTF
ncbi:MAG: BamA/TamA family outer membrane protein, partial [Ramlibacter sp.]